VFIRAVAIDLDSFRHNPPVLARSGGAVFKSRWSSATSPQRQLGVIATPAYLSQTLFSDTPDGNRGRSPNPASKGNAIKLRGRLKGVSSPRVSKGLILLALPHHRATDTQLNLMALSSKGWT
jgi:hypothetical protein